MPCQNAILLKNFFKQYFVDFSLWISFALQFYFVLHFFPRQPNWCFFFVFQFISSFFFFIFPPIFLEISDISSSVTSFFYLHCFLFAFGTLFFARPPNRCFFFDLRFFPYDFLLLHFFFDLIVFPAYAFSSVFLLMAFIYFFLFSLFPCWLCFYDCYLASTT